MVPAGHKVCVWVGASRGRVNICFPTHFIVCHDKDVNWTKLKETHRHVSIFWLFIHAYFKSYLFSFETLKAHENTHYPVSSVSSRLLSVSAFTEVLHKEILMEWESLMLQGQKRVNFAGPSKPTHLTWVQRGSHSSGKLWAVLVLCFSFHTHILQLAPVSAQSDWSLVSSQTQFKDPVYL